MKTDSSPTKKGAGIASLTGSLSPSRSPGSLARTFRHDVEYYATSQCISPRRLAQFHGAPKTTGTISADAADTASRIGTPLGSTQKQATLTLQRRRGAHPSLQAPPVPLLPPVLQFESWWTECTQTGEPFQGIEVCRSQERQYVVIQFDPKDRSFLVQSRGLATHVDAGQDLTSSRTTPMHQTPPLETVVLDRLGRPLEEWDLHVGGELRIFGRSVTLKKCSGETMRWLDYQARRLIRTKIRLEKELSKFCFVSFAQPRHVGLHAPLDNHVTKGMAKQDPYVAHQSHKTEVTLGGKTNLRPLVDEVSWLLERLAKYRPLKPIDEDIDHALTRRAEAIAAELAEAAEAAMSAEIDAAAGGGIRALALEGEGGVGGDGDGGGEGERGGGGDSGENVKDGGGEEEDAPATAEEKEEEKEVQGDGEEA